MWEHKRLCLSRHQFDLQVCAHLLDVTPQRLSLELTRTGREAAFAEGTCVGIHWLWSASSSLMWTAPASPTAHQFTLK